MLSLTVLPDKVDRPKATITAENTIKLASYPEDDRRHEPVLRGLVESWVASGCRYDRWAQANPKEREILAREASRRTLTFWYDRKGKPRPVLLSGGGMAAESAVELGRQFVDGRLARPQNIKHEEVTGYQAFVDFLLCAAPRFDVGRCVRCLRFYWNRWGHANKRFCTRQCSQIQIATDKQNERVAKERREKNVKIKQAIDALISVASLSSPLWDKLASRDWKSWVAERAGVTQSYVTRAINRGLRGEKDGLKLTKRKRTFLEKLKSQPHGAD